jgi:hypothetical protein
MAPRSRSGASWESWVDRQIREAEERGEFADLPGKGRPLADIDRPYDALWWVRRKLREEQLSYTPPTLALRREVERALEAVEAAASEDEVRRILGGVNARIAEQNARPASGPPSNLAPLDVERIVASWEEERPP